MKFIWEAKDIEPGVKYSREGIGEVWMIIRDPADDNAFWSVSLEDGCIGSLPATKAEKAKQLTQDKYLPMFAMEGLGIKP